MYSIYVVNRGVETVFQKKVKGVDVPAELLSGYRLMDMDILLAIITSVPCSKNFCSW